MGMMKSTTKFYKILPLIFIFLTCIYVANIIYEKNSVPLYSLNQIADQDTTLNQCAIPDFWNLTEIQSIPLNISIEDIEYVWDANLQKNFTLQHLIYTSQYWNNTPLRIYAALVIPDNRSGQLQNLPGIIVIHGLGGDHTSMLDLAYFAAAYNYSVLAIDLPGHGNSGGPPPTQNWIIPDLTDYDGNITAELLNQTHFYLIARAAVRAVDVLLNQSFIDPLRIAMAGGSYGGLTTMFASNIYWERVRSAIPVVASGNLEVSFNTPYSLTNLVVNPNEIDLSEPPFPDLIQYFDPIFYVNSSHNPATLFICGTNDDFFPLETFNDTFYATHNQTKAMCMSPGGHHGILMQPMEGTIMYWLNYTLNNGPAPPTIQFLSRSIKPVFFGHKLNLMVNISCETPISKVIFASHREIMGAAWQTREMNPINQSTWTVEIQNLPISADITYLIMVELEGELYTMFSTSAWRDTLTTWVEIPFFILIGLGLFLSVFLLVRHDVKKVKPTITEQNTRKLSYLYGCQFAGIGATENVIAISLFLPLAVILPQSNSIEVSVSLLLSEFIDFLPIVTLIVFGILVAGFILAMSKPLLGGIINILIPASLFIFGIFLIILSRSFSNTLEELGFSGNLLGIGSGLILWLVMGGIQIIFGISKRKYLKNLRIS